MPLVDGQQLQVDGRKGMELSQTSSNFELGRKWNVLVCAFQDKESRHTPVFIHFI